MPTRLPSICFFACLVCLVACVVGSLAPRAASAHAVGTSHLTLELRGDILAGSWRVGAADLEPVLGLDVDGDRRIGARELELGAAAIGAYLGSRLEVEARGAPCPTRVSEPRLDGADLLARVEARCAGLGEGDALALRYDLFFEHDRSHQGFLQVTRGDATHGAVFTHQQRTHTLAARPPGAWAAARAYLLAGVWHIAIGYDHIAFLLTLLLPLVLRRRGAPAPSGWEPLPSPSAAWGRALRVVTAFTLAHSLTLSLAALDVVRPPERAIEIVIALSVALAALANLSPYTGERSHGLAFPFGLVHGFGFANAVGELGLPKGHALVALLGFNAGVELGQLAIVVLALPLALALRRSRRYVPWGLRGGSAAIGALALFWVVERGVASPAPLADVEAPTARDGSAGALPPGLARLAQRWTSPPAGGDARPHFGARIGEAILVPALARAVAAACEPERPGEGRTARAQPEAVPSVEACRAALDHGDVAPALARAGARAQARAAQGDVAEAARSQAARGLLLALIDVDGGVAALERARDLDPSHAGAGLWLAALEARRGRLEPAEAALRALLASGVDAPESDPQRVRAWSLLGDVLAARKRWLEAEPALRRGLDGALARGDHANAAGVQRRLGDVTLALARPREALEHYQRAIELGRALGSAPRILAARAGDHRNAAAVAQLLDDLPLAARLYRRALELDERRGDRERARDDLSRLCQVYRQLDQLDEARACLERALALDEAAGARDRQAEDLAQLGHLHQLADRLAEAHAHYERALAIPELPPALRADLHANLGNVHRRRGDVESARALYRRALDSYRGLRDASKAARVEQYLTALARPTTRAAASSSAPPSAH